MRCQLQLYLNSLGMVICVIDKDNIIKMFRFRNIL